MIIVMKPKAADKNIKAVTQYIEAVSYTHLSSSKNRILEKLCPTLL